MNDETKKRNPSASRRITRAALARLENAASVVLNYPDLNLGQRMKIGTLDTEPRKIGQMPEGLTSEQQALLEGVFKRFTVQKINKYIEGQVRHINYKRQLGESLRLLFDEHGRPPANAPLEDIIAARKKIEAEIHMLEAICSAMRVGLSKVKEIEDMALESIHGQFEK